MIDGEVFYLFLYMIFAAVARLILATVLAKVVKKKAEEKRMDQYKQRSAERTEEKTSSSYEQSRRQAELKQRLEQKYGRSSYSEQDAKHAKHVADAHEHGHQGEEEHYEEIVGSLGEVNDEGCADLSGVRFIANDIAYEIQSQENVDYDRLAQAMVLGEVINDPRFKTPYTRRK